VVKRFGLKLDSFLDGKEVRGPMGMNCGAGDSDASERFEGGGCKRNTGFSERGHGGTDGQEPGHMTDEFQAGRLGGLPDGSGIDLVGHGAIGFERKVEKIEPVAGSPGDFLFRWTTGIIGHSEFHSFTLTDDGKEDNLKVKANNRKPFFHTLRRVQKQGLRAGGFFRG